MIENKLVQKKATFSNFITSEAIKNKVNQMIGGQDGQRFITSIISAVSTNPALAECDHSTILSSAMIGEALKLSPSPQLGQYFLVPFNDNKSGRKVATFQLGYKGYIQLAIRSGQYRKLNVVAIKEGEMVKYDAMKEEIEVNLIEDDEKREEAKTIGYYAMFEYMNGFQKTIYWSRKKMEAHATKYSPAFRSRKGYSFWEKDFDAMGIKTLIRQLISKWGIMSIEMQKAFESDSFDTENVVPEFVDNGKQVENDPFIETPVKLEDMATDNEGKLVNPATGKAI